MIASALGFRAKTGHAIAVVLALRDGVPSIEWRGEIGLTDPAVPQTAQPYHAVMELPWKDSEQRALRFVAAIEEAAAREIGALRDALRSRGLSVVRVAVVGSADRDLAKIGNPHIRAHAAEGIAFRRAIEMASKRLRLSCRSFPERTIVAMAPAAKLAAFGKQVGAPWRADQRAAAAAAWAVLAGGATR
ncbi:MAG TPA: hypothetical protein VKH35_02410 [Thermoanaerobaculia bacterium]|nr:hypothetical protein [Thermoanaerobaculia bacterium]